MEKFFLTIIKGVTRKFQTIYREAWWRSGRASDFEWRGPGFDPHKRHCVVSLSKMHYLPTVLVKPRKSWLCPDMTEKLFTGTLSLNTNIQTKSINGQICEKK